MMVWGYPATVAKYLHCVSKKQDTRFFIITLAIMNRFSKFFHCHIREKIL